MKKMDKYTCLRCDIFNAVPVSIIASVITLTVISFDRFCAIFFPLSQALFHKHKTITAIIWLISLTTMAPNLLLFQVFQGGGRYYCYQVWPWDKDVLGRNISHPEDIPCDRFCPFVCSSTVDNCSG